MKNLTGEDSAILARIASKSGGSEDYFSGIRKVEERDYRRTFTRLYHRAHPRVGHGTPPNLSAQVRRNIEAYDDEGWTGMGLAVY